jgi:hypothetical protein
VSKRVPLAAHESGGEETITTALVLKDLRRIGLQAWVLFGLLCVASAITTGARPSALRTKATLITTPSHSRGSATLVGVRTITLADQGQILHLAVGETFLLHLGGGTWDVQITQPDVIEPDRGAKLSLGDQGVYRARAAGLTELVAVAIPHCMGDLPPCRVMVAAFRLLIVVR